MSRVDQCFTIAKSKGVECIQCSMHHIQFKVADHVFNYWPESKKRSMHDMKAGDVTGPYSPEQAVAEVLKRTGIRKAKAELVAKAREKAPAPTPIYAGKFKRCRTRGAGIRHFYSGDIPPWELPGEFSFLHKADEIRYKAHRLIEKANAMIARANELEESEASD